MKFHVVKSLYTSSQHTERKCMDHSFMNGRMKRVVNTWDPQQMDCSEPAVAWSSPRDLSTTTPALRKRYHSFPLLIKAGLFYTGQ